MMYLLRFEIYYRRLTDWWISVNQIIAARERRRLVKNQSHMIWWLLRRIYFGYKMTHSVSWCWILIKMEKLYRAHLKSYYTKQRNICVTVESTHSEKPIATVVMFVQLSYKAIWNFTAKIICTYHVLWEPEVEDRQMLPIEWVSLQLSPALVLTRFFSAQV